MCACCRSTCQFDATSPCEDSPIGKERVFAWRGGTDTGRLVRPTLRQVGSVAAARATEGLRRRPIDLDRWVALVDLPLEERRYRTARRAVPRERTAHMHTALLKLDAPDDPVHPQHVSITGWRSHGGSLVRIALVALVDKGDIDKMAVEVVPNVTDAQDGGKIFAQHLVLHLQRKGRRIRRVRISCPRCNIG